MQNREAGLAAVGTLASAVLAASHCMGAVALLVFGPTVGALSALGALERCRPYFIAAGFAFWGFGFYRVHFRSGAGSGEMRTALGIATATPRMRTLLWVGFGVLLVAVALPTVAAHLASS